jgi:hypothetical protein
VVRQAIDNFALETKSREILSLIGTFNQQWTNFKLALSDAREKLLKLHDHEVFSTRLNVLERPLKNIEKIRAEQGLPAGDIAVEAFEKIAEGNVKEKMGRTKKEQVEIA